MIFEDLVKVNKDIKTTDIKGKQYAEVNERIKAFRNLFPNGTISTEIVNMTHNEKGKGVVIIKATAMNEEGHILGTGHAYEVEGSSFINNTSYIENAETSAVGRALGMLGIGIDVSVASYEEVANAVKQQDEQQETKAKAKTAPATKAVEPESEYPFEVISDEAPKKTNRDKFREFTAGWDRAIKAKIVKECGLTDESPDSEWQPALMRAIAIKAGATI